MKKVYALTVAMALSAGIFAQQKQAASFQKAPAIKSAVSFNKAGTALNKGGNSPKISSTPVFTEDFESVTTPNIPANWTNVSPATDGGFFTGDYVDAMAGGYWSVDDHTTFIMTVDDICNCTKDNEYLTMPAFNFTGKTGMGLTFDVFFTVLTVEEAFVEASTDNGATWTQLFAIPDDNAWTSTSISLAAYNNVSNLLVRFHYMDNGEWGYGLAIDNVVVDGLPDNELVLTDGYANMGWDRDFYPVIPKTQTLPLTFEGHISNNGAQSQTNVNLSVQITQDNLTAVFSDLMPSNSYTAFASGSFDSLHTSTAYTASAVGSYSADLEVTQNETDFNPANNVMTFNFDVSDSVFGRDNGVQSYVIGTGMYTGAETELEVANYFMVANATEATSISVYVDKSNTKLGGSDVMIAKVLDAATMSELYVTDVHDIVSADLDNWVTLALPSGSTLADSSQIYVSVQIISSGVSGKNVYLGTDVTSYQDPGFVLLYIPGDQWYYIQSSGAPMIRLNLGNDASAISEVTNNVSSLTQNQPNPFNVSTRIEYALNNNASNVSLDVMDLTGKVVMSMNEGSKTSGNYFLTVDASQLSAGTYFYTLNVDGAKQTRKMTVAK